MLAVAVVGVAVDADDVFGLAAAGGAVGVAVDDDDVLDSLLQCLTTGR